LFPGNTVSQIGVERREEFFVVFFQGSRFHVPGARKVTASGYLSATGLSQDAKIMRRRTDWEALNS
jgi:hypothetical protein